ncbi:MAG: F0F1 ATP synthase subunit B [Paludibacteraceae bacterium]|nr:F0F1 ATP synthase subunit B [Paludibacteraceae bacterium]
MSLLMPETGLVFWMLLAFGIVFFILAKFGWPVITGMVEKRSNFINDSVKAAEEANKQLENIKIETEAILAKAQQEQMRILNEASELRNQIIQDAKENALVESQKIIEDAKRQIQIEKEKSLNEMKGQIAELSVDIAEKVIRADLRKENQQSELIDKLLNEITLN